MDLRIYGVLAATSLGLFAIAPAFDDVIIWDGSAADKERPSAAPAVNRESDSGYTNSIGNMANTYRQAATTRESQERQAYFDRSILLVSDGETAMTQPGSMRDHYDFQPKYLVEIRVNDIGYPRSYPVHSLSFCEVDAGASNIEAAVDRMRNFSSSEEGARCGDDPQRTTLVLPDQFRAALMHVHTCLPAIASYASKSAVPDDLKTRCQDFATLRF
ncbi:MAG: hypothetical protein ACXW4B_05375 [Micavibrio sp.]